MTAFCVMQRRMPLALVCRRGESLLPTAKMLFSDCEAVDEGRPGRTWDPSSERGKKKSTQSLLHSYTVIQVLLSTRPDYSDESAPKPMCVLQFNFNGKYVYQVNANGKCLHLNSNADFKCCFQMLCHHDFLYSLLAFNGWKGKFVL